MPREARKVPRLCPHCKTHMIRRKYDKFCTWCKRDIKKEKKEVKEFTKLLLRALET